MITCTSDKDDVQDMSKTPIHQYTDIYSFFCSLLSCTCLVGCVAAITTLGGKPNEGGERVDYMGNSNVIEQAGILGVERIILVTRYT